MWSGCIVVDRQCRGSNGNSKIEGYMWVSDKGAHHWDTNSTLTLHTVSLLTHPPKLASPMKPGLQSSPDLQDIAQWGMSFSLCPAWSMFSNQPTMSMHCCHSVNLPMSGSKCMHSLLTFLPIPHKAHKHFDRAAYPNIAPANTNSDTCVNLLSHLSHSILSSPSNYYTLTGWQGRIKADMALELKACLRKITGIDVYIWWEGWEERYSECSIMS